MSGAKFIKLTTIKGEVIYVRVDTIVRFAMCSDGGTHIEFRDRAQVFKETLEQIIAMIES